jgi:hypothetical protein
VCERHFSILHRHRRRWADNSIALKNRALSRIANATLSKPLSKVVFAKRAPIPNIKITNLMILLRAEVVENNIACF